MTHISDLKPDERNARKHNSRNIGMIAESLQKYGPARSISIDENNTILAGNGVVEASMQIGIEHVRVYDRETGNLEPAPLNGAQYIFATRLSNLTDKEKTLYAVADNRTAELAEWNVDVLAGLNEDGDLEQFWFPQELAQVLAANDDPFDPNAEWQGMPEFDHDDERPAKQLIISFRHIDDMAEFARLVNQNVMPSTKSIWFPERNLESIRDKGYISDDA